MKRILVAAIALSLCSSVASAKKCNGSGKTGHAWYLEQHAKFLERRNERVKSGWLLPSEREMLRTTGNVYGITEFKQPKHLFTKGAPYVGQVGNSSGSGGATPSHTGLSYEVKGNIRTVSYDGKYIGTDHASTGYYGNKIWVNNESGNQSPRE